MISGRVSDSADRNHDEDTAIGVGIPVRRPRNADVQRQLELGPFLAAFDAGMYEVAC